MVCMSNYNAVMLPRNYKGDFVKNPVGTGPFMLKEYVAKQKCTMVKNPTYWGKDAAGNQLPYLDEVNWVLVQDESAANLQLQSGAVDFQPQTVFQGSQALFSDPNLRVDIYPGTGIREVAFNVTKEPWKSGGAALRQAVAYCLDREAINKALYDGRSSLGYDTFWEPTVFPGSPPPTPRAQDYDKAKQLLTDAGHADGLEIELTFSKYLENPQFAQLIQAQCKPAGINVKLNFISYDAYYAGGADYNATTPWLNAAMPIVEWGSRPTPGVYAQAMLLPDQHVELVALEQQGLRHDLRRVHVDCRRGDAHGAAPRSCRRSSRTTHPSSWPSTSAPAAHTEEDRVRHPGPRQLLLPHEGSVQDRVRSKHHTQT